MNTPDRKEPPITREKFESYVSVLNGGDIDTNNEPVFCHLSGLSPEEVRHITSNMRNFSNIYPDVAFGL